MAYAVKILGKCLDVFVAEIGKYRAARGRNVGQAFRLAKPVGSAADIFKRDPRHRDLLKIRLEERGKGKVPKRRGNNDLIC